MGFDSDKAFRDFSGFASQALRHDDLDQNPLKGGAATMKRFMDHAVVRCGRYMFRIDGSPRCSNAWDMVGKIEKASDDLRFQCYKPYPSSGCAKPVPNHIRAVAGHSIVACVRSRAGSLPIDHTTVRALFRRTTVGASDGIMNTGLQTSRWHGGKEGRHDILFSSVCPTLRNSWSKKHFCACHKNVRMHCRKISQNQKGHCITCGFGF